jgi:hypothetical protein
MRRRARASPGARIHQSAETPTPPSSASAAATRIRDTPAVRTHPLLAVSDRGVDAVHCAIRIRTAPGFPYLRRLCLRLPCERDHECGGRQDSAQDRGLGFHCFISRFMATNASPRCPGATAQFDLRTRNLLCGHCGDLPALASIFRNARHAPLFVTRAIRSWVPPMIPTTGLQAVSNTAKDVRR